MEERAADTYYKYPLRNWFGYELVMKRGEKSLKKFRIKYWHWSQVVFSFLH